MRNDVQRRRQCRPRVFAVVIAFAVMALGTLSGCAQDRPSTLSESVQADANRQIGRLGVALVAPVTCADTPPSTVAPPATRADLPPTSFPGPPQTTAPVPEVGLRCTGTAVDQRPVVADYVGKRDGEGLLVIMLGPDQLFYGECPNCKPR